MPRGARSALPPKPTLNTLAARPRIPTEALRSYLYHGRAALAPTRRLVVSSRC
ncbi:hypothetical protein [Gemmatimonas sp.]|uniref:hypothetical protein n=1 Tax=Gemmatimonas sp. TaxID=1962908 RepID=UPI00356B1BB3